jgi:hypothetical protein
MWYYYYEYVIIIEIDDLELARARRLRDLFLKEHPLDNKSSNSKKGG